MLRSLSSTHESLLREVEDEWLALFSGGYAADPSVILEKIPWLYSVAGRRPPEQIEVGGPLKAMESLLERHRPHSQSCCEQEIGFWLARRLGRQVMDQLHQAVDEQLAQEVYARLGVCAGPLVRDASLHLPGVVNEYAGSGLARDLRWSSALDFFFRVGALDFHPITNWLELLKAGLWSSLFYEDLAVAIRPPDILRQQSDAAGEMRMHNTRGPALAWQDDFASYAIEGELVPSHWVEQPQSISLEEIYGVFNLDRRKTLIDQVGAGRFLQMTKSSLVDSDVDGAGMERRLLRVKVGSGFKWCLLEVRCPSKGDLHYLWVPPSMSRCSQAVAWTFGFEVPDYLPLIEA